MLTVHQVEKWLAESDHSKKWLARECGIDVRTVQNWFAAREIPKKQHKRILELMEMESETLHFIKVPLRHNHFVALNKKVSALDMPQDEYCARVIIDSI